MSPGGGGEGIYQHSFITIYCRLHTCVSKHTERKKVVHSDLPIEIFHYESAGVVAFSSCEYKKVTGSDFLNVYAQVTVVKHADI